MLTKGYSDDYYFSEEYFLGLLKDMKSGRIKASNGRFQVSDSMVTGLRAQIFVSGVISYHVSYYYDEGTKRPFLLFGYANKDHPLYLTVADARHIAKTIIGLAEKGTNVQDGLLPRLIFELNRDGLKWRLPAGMTEGRSKKK